MPLAEKTDELKRLIQAFESEAGKFFPLTLSLLHVTQEGASFNRPMKQPNHAIMLWQYYGAILGEQGAAGLAKNLEDSDLKWGIRGAKLTCFAVLEGDGPGEAVDGVLVGDVVRHHRLVGVAAFDR